MRNCKFQFLPNSARTWLFSCQPPVALLAALHLQEGRQGSWEGQVEGVWLLWFVPRRCWQCLCVSRGAGMSPSLAGGSGGWEEDGSAWGGWKCHVFPTQTHSRLKAEARAPQYCIVPSAGWSQTPPAESQLSVVWEGPGVRLSSSHSWAQGHLPKQGLHWPSACPAGMAQGPCSPGVPQGMLPVLHTTAAVCLG